MTAYRVTHEVFIETTKYNVNIEDFGIGVRIYENTTKNDIYIKELNLNGNEYYREYEKNGTIYLLVYRVYNKTTKKEEPLFEQIMRNSNLIRKLRLEVI